MRHWIRWQALRVRNVLQEQKGITVIELILILVGIYAKHICKSLERPV